MTSQKLIVSTPNGPRYHGEIKGDSFHRKVNMAKDLLRIFNAWSIHPDALKECEAKGVAKLVYTDEDERYEISLVSAIENGFERTFSGGPTFYIPLKFWKKGEEDLQGVLL